VSAAAWASPALGVVEAFDERVGLGEVRLDDGSRLAFHAVELADGSRRVDVGARVALRVAPRRSGRVEATCLVTTGADGGGAGRGAPAC